MVYTSISDSGGTESQFTRRKSIVISHTGALTDYQKLLTIDYEPEMQASFADIRFNSIDGDYIPHWIESHVDSDTADVWIKYDGLDGDTIIRMYYGNAGLTSESDADSVFILYDDFTGSGAPDSTKWDVVKVGSASAVAALDGTGNLQLSGLANTISAGMVVSKNAIVSNGFSITIRRKWDNIYYPSLSIGSGQLQDENGAQSDFWSYGLSNGYWFRQQFDQSRRIFESPESSGISTLDVNETTFGSSNTFYTEKYIYDIDGNLKWYFDDVLKLDATDTTYLSNSKKIQIQQGEHSSGLGGSSYIDYILVQAFTVTEPTYSIDAEQHQRQSPTFIN